MRTLKANKHNKTGRDSDLKNTLMVVRGQLGTLGWSCTHGYIQNG